MNVASNGLGRIEPGRNMVKVLDWNDSDGGRSSRLVDRVNRLG